MKTELIIGRSPNYYLIPVLDGAEWATEDAGIAGSFTFSIPPVKDLYINEGDIVKFKVNGKKVFAGFVFTQEWDKSGIVKVTAYDSLRYLKSKDTYNFIGKTASEILTQIATEHQIPLGDITDTKYRIPSMIMVNLSLFDIIYKAMKLTEKAGYGKFILYDDFGKLSLKHETEMATDVLIDISTAQDFLFTSDINKETYNIIKLVENGESIVVKDESTVREWGDLQYFGTVENGENAQEKAKVLLEMFNKRHKTLTVKGVLGDPSVRGGSIISVKLNLGGEKVDSLMLVKECRHVFNQGYFMRLVLAGYVPLVESAEPAAAPKKTPAQYARYTQYESDDAYKASEPPIETEPECIMNWVCTVKTGLDNTAASESIAVRSLRINENSAEINGKIDGTIEVKVIDKFDLYTLNHILLEKAEERAKIDPLYTMPSRIIQWTIPETDVIERKATDLIKVLKSGETKITGRTSDGIFRLDVDLKVIIPEYYILYHAMGGDGAPINQIKKHNESLILSEVIPTREGYNFIGWALTSAGTGTLYYPGGVFTVNKRTVLYAVWEERHKLPVVSMTFDAVWGNPLSTSNITAEELALVLNENSKDSSNVNPHWLGDLAPTFIQAGNQYGINPVFLASFAPTEGGWDRNVNTMVRDQKNIYSWSGDSKEYNNRWKTFESYEGCINFWAKTMVEDYFTPNQGKNENDNKHFDTNGNLILSAWLHTYNSGPDGSIEKRIEYSEPFFKAVINKLGSAR